MNPFVKAVKEQAKLRMALIGASGSGKTWTALQLATHLAGLDGGRVALIDTEGRSARKYAGAFDFDVLDLSNNYDPKEYIKGIQAAAENGYAVLVIDSLTHAWNGAGGVLSIVDKTAKKMGGNDWAGWSEGRPAQNALVDAIINASIHVIGTMRSKTEWALQEGKNGKTQPVKIGLAPVQSADFEYEFDIVAQMDMNHTISISKTRCSVLDKGEEITDAAWMGETLHAWLTDGEMPVKVWHKRPDWQEWLKAQFAKYPNVDSKNGFKQIDAEATRWSSLNISEAELISHLSDINQPASDQPAPEAEPTPAPDEPPASDVIRGNASDKPTKTAFNITTTPEMLARAGLPANDVPLFSDEELAQMEKERA